MDAKLSHLIPKMVGHLRLIFQKLPFHSPPFFLYANYIGRACDGKALLLHTLTCSYLIAKNKQKCKLFTISPQYKNANIVNLVLALPLKVNQYIVAFNLKM